MTRRAGSIAEPGPNHYPKYGTVNVIVTAIA